MGACPVSATPSQGQEGQIPMRVLLVDDHPMVRAGLANAVRGVAANAEVDETDSVAGALERLQQGEYRLILLDLMLPDASPDVLKTIDQAAGGADILVVSMLEDPKWVRRVLEEGAAGFLPKSSSPAVTKHALNLVLEGETYVPRQVLSGEEAGSGAASGAAGGQWSNPDPQAARRFGLSPMQQRVLVELGKGHSNQQISDDLGIALSTVKAHVGAVIQKLDARNRTHAVLIGREAGLL